MNFGGYSNCLPISVEAPDLSLQHMFVAILTMADDDVIVVVVVVVVVAGGWTMLDNCCLHSHFTFAILFQSLVSESTTSAVSIWKRRICHYSMSVAILTMMMMLLLLLLQEVLGPCWTIVAYTHTLLLPSFFSHWWLSESTTSAVSIYNHMFGFCSCHEYSFGKISLFCSFLSIYYHRQQDTVTAEEETAAAGR